MNVLDLLKMFVNDGRVITLLALILLDVALGIIAAIKLKKFDWKKVGQFYRTMVIPYGLGYLSLWGVGFFLDPVWLGENAELAGDALRWTAWTLLIATLISSIMTNLQMIGIVPKRE